MKKTQTKDEKRLRLAVFRSNKTIYAQIIDDEKRKTLVAASEKDLKKEALKGVPKLARAEQLGKILAGKALKKGIKRVKFDRRGYRYHGRVKALADGARSGGLSF